MGIVITGLLGVLIEAKELGLIQAIKPFLDRLTGEIGFRISNKLYQEVLELANEWRP